MGHCLQKMGLFERVLARKEIRGYRLLGALILYLYVILACAIIIPPLHKHHLRRGPFTCALTTNETNIPHHVHNWVYKFEAEALAWGEAQHPLPANVNDNATVKLRRYCYYNQVVFNISTKRPEHCRRAWIAGMVQPCYYRPHSKPVFWKSRDVDAKIWHPPTLAPRIERLAIIQPQQQQLQGQFQYYHYPYQPPIVVERDIEKHGSFIIHQENYVANKKREICSVCLDNLEDTDVLPCHHSFCYDCISTHMLEDGHNSCPLCRTPVALPSPPPLLQLNLSQFARLPPEHLKTWCGDICGFYDESFFNTNNVSARQLLLMHQDNLRLLFTNRVAAMMVTYFEYMQVEQRSIAANANFGVTLVEFESFTVDELVDYLFIKRGITHHQIGRDYCYSPTRPQTCVDIASEWSRDHHHRGIFTVVSNRRTD